MPEDTASLTDLLQRLSEGQAASHDDIVAAFQTVMAGEADPAQTGALLGMLAMKGVDRDQLTAAATVMRDNATRVEAPDHLTLVDTCGTGGDHAGTFNISTAAALVTAGAGREHDIAVAKHGNRSVTSNSGSSQVLEALGVTLTAPPAVLRRCLEEAGICFCFAPAHHPAMKHVVPVRKALGFRTLFNVVGPLTNPAGARRQMLGVFDPELTTLMAEVLKDLGAERAMVVHGAGGLDELSLAGESTIAELADGEVRSRTVTPDDVGLSSADNNQLHADSPTDSARIIRSILAGETGPARDIVCFNAGGALWAGGLVDDLAAGVTAAQSAIDEGQAADALERLVHVSAQEA